MPGIVMVPTQFDMFSDLENILDYVNGKYDLIEGQILSLTNNESERLKLLQTKITIVSSLKTKINNLISSQSNNPSGDFSSEYEAVIDLRKAVERLFRV